MLPKYQESAGSQPVQNVSKQTLLLDFVEIREDEIATQNDLEWFQRHTLRDVLPPEVDPIAEAAVQAEKAVRTLKSLLDPDLWQILE